MFLQKGVLTVLRAAWAFVNHPSLCLPSAPMDTIQIHWAGMIFPNTPWLKTAALNHTGHERNNSNSF